MRIRKSKQHVVGVLLHSFFSIVLVIAVLSFFSCKEKEKTTFHSQIVSQTLLNETEMFHKDGVDTYKINYKSDGLQIEGFIARPTQYKANIKLPAIIYCRGGNQSFGAISDYQLKIINSLAARGFVVLASQLRGNMYSQGVDEFGGKDVNDILKLIDIAKDLHFVDTKNIHVFGISRGGMNTYQVSKLSDDINSIAIVGSPTNILSLSKFRPKMYTKVMQPLIGDSLTKRKEYEARSAIFWHNKLNEPTLILHGTDDSRVQEEEARKLVDSFTMSNKKDFQFKVFEGGNHSLSNFEEERNELIFNWFKKNKK
ncbi:prolyl oligopeptidase family serine peptidase [Lacinutrix sp. C3R15]|uniref:alpha/beta hydrolase family protein n=1 Tax=Flavobacteriaceae TaxID=49546 RepID=UPI001C0864F5|nr:MULTISPECIES: prolyl oligopeptidase family serine peptidase [Flavobacteriaceae]MBU2938041.1 prolyl oligopeptidase family serine peptidase [Lacinutrix sp. C3R15]MDO6621355.1 prolyl oligopeptidase family serine peptidase [Oceanihabitans sp. 1_MG-2023]